MLLEEICEKTDHYIATVSKSERKKTGQFFTSINTARYMASLCSCPKEKVKVLDPGAGSGILSSAIIEALSQNSKTKSIVLILYENDSGILPLLKENIEVMQQFCQEHNIRFKVELRIDNFITNNISAWMEQRSFGIYDIVICNPPYKKIPRTSPEASAMESIIYGQPNIYFLFMAMALRLLKKGGDYIFIVPRSWTSGLYFTKFREYFFQHINIQGIHLFKSRNQVFDKEQVLQETIILIGTRSLNFQQDTLTITTSNGAADFKYLRPLKVSKTSCIQVCNGHYLLLPSTPSEVEILAKVNLFDSSVIERGYKFKTGLVVDFRNRELLKSSNSSRVCPIIWPINFKNGKIVHPQNNYENQYILRSYKSLLMIDKDYLMIKRFTSKEEKRRLQPALYFSKYNDDRHYISTENHLNYLTKKSGSLSIEELYGFFVLLSSTFWDQYYRILNGSTQVNAAELNSMPVPPENDIKKLGQRAMQCASLTTFQCDKLLEDYYENR